MPITKSEVRHDDIHDRFVIIAPKRDARPNDFAPKKSAPAPTKETTCPFCNDPDVPETTLLALCGRKHWCVRVILNKFPAVTKDNPGAYGTQEVVVETPDHNVEFADLTLDHLHHIFQAYIDRIKTISQDKKIKYILVFKNRGGVAGASLLHAHSQIIATGFIPPHIVQRLSKAEEWKINNGICYYCDLLAKEEKGPRLIASDKHTVAFAPYASLYGYEAWVLPRRHIDNITRMTSAESRSFVKTVRHIIQKINTLGLSYNFYLHQVITDKGEHFYLRIAPRGSVWGGVELGSRMVINSIPPEDAAEYFRGVK